MSEIIHERFWCPRDGTIAFADDGYLIDPSTSWGKAVNPDLVTFEEIAPVRCLILLGEPGAGKTTALKRAETMLASDAPAPLVLHRDLGMYQTDLRLERDVFNHVKFGEWIAGSSDLHLFLDSLDESIVRIETIASLLLQQLSDCPRDRLYLRIACRTSQWPSEFEEQLTSLFGSELTKVYEIVPLRKADVASSAEAAEVDPAAFLDAVAERAVMPFAARPITLKLLLNLFRIYLITARDVRPPD